MLLQSNAVAVSLAVDKKQENYYNMDQLYINNDMVYASNGHSLYATELAPIAIQEDEWPGNVSVSNLDRPVFIPGKYVAEMSKKTMKGDIPVLGCLRVHDEEPGMLTIQATDLEQFNTVQFSDKEKIYPNVTEIMAVNEGCDMAQCRISIAELELLLKVAKKAGLKSKDLDTINFSINKDSTTSPMGVDFYSADADTTIKGWIMPCLQ